MEVNKVPIEQVPLPDGFGPGRPARWPYRDLQIGESFFVPNRINVNTTKWSHVTGFKFTARGWTDENGVKGLRVFRIA